MKSSFFDNTVRLHIGHFAPLSPLFAASHEVFCHQPSIKCISAQIVRNQVAIDSISMEDSDFEPDTPLGKRAAAQKSKGEEAAVDLTVSDEEDVVYVTEVKSDPIPSSSAAADDQNMVIFDDAQEIAIPTYSLGRAPSGRATCNRCGEKIEQGSLRCTVYLEASLFTKHQHINCTVFDNTIKTVDDLVSSGYEHLSEEWKEIVRKRVRDSPAEFASLNAPIDPDELVRKEWREQAEEPVDLNATLLPYQKEGLAWMKNQEVSTNRGGILADEMGMGKTIQTISLMLAHKIDTESKEQARMWDESDMMNAIADKGSILKSEMQVVVQEEAEEVKSAAGASSSSQALTKSGKPRKPRAKKPITKSIAVPETADPPNYIRGGTLLVLPTGAIRQWQSEITKFTLPGALTYQVYHGNSREDSLEGLTGTDIVITSYKVMESEFRKATAGAKIACSLCGRKYYPEKYRTHRKYMCRMDTNAKRTEGQSKTQRKKQKTGEDSPTLAAEGSDTDDSDDVDNDDNEEEDEISKQKRAIKAAGNKKGVKASSSSSSLKSLASSRASKSPSPSPSPSPSTLKETASTSKASPPAEAGPSSVVKREDDKGADSECTLSDDSFAEPMESKASPPFSKGKGKGTGTGTANAKGKAKAKAKAPAAKKSAKPKGKTSAAKDGRSKKRKKGDDDDDFEDPGSDGDDDDNDDDDDDDGDVGKMEVIESPPAAGAAHGAKKGKGKGKKAEELNPEVEAEIARALAKAQKANGTVVSKLHKISWFRVVLDEAHMIKDRSTSTSKAVFNLISVYKWCLTGTPLQNRVSELYSLVRFLRFDPHAYYMCRAKDCHCKSLHYRFKNGYCESCDHTAMQHSCHFNLQILNPIKAYGYVDLGKKAMLKLKNEVLDELLLRRTKTTRAEDIQLPPRIVRVRKECLDSFEEDFYKNIYTQSKTQFSTYVASGTVLNNYANIFEVLMRLRQALDHPYLVAFSNTQHNESLVALSDANIAARRQQQKHQLETDLKSSHCGLCHEQVEDPRRAECGHLFCRSCVSDLLDDAPIGTVTDCPVCKEPLSIDLNTAVTVEALEAAGAMLGEDPAKESSSSSSPSSITGPKLNSGVLTSMGMPYKPRRNSILDKIRLEDFKSSSKIEALMQELHRMQETDLGAKAIVFSQFTNMLDLIEFRINTDKKSSGYDTSFSNVTTSCAVPIRCAILSGGLSIDQRDSIIKQFNSDPTLKVLLISLKAGGVALNLTVASHIFLMDPWWNPAAEYQAIDRTHRFGQHKPIFATRFIMENTIEERILNLQEKKRLVFDGTIGGDAASMGRLTSEDMGFLFS